MAKLSATRRVVKEDYDKQFQPLIDKLAFTLNPLFDQLASAFNKGITIEDNLNMEVRDITVKVDANGVPTSNTSFKSLLKTKLKGMVVLRAINVTDGTVFPVGQPFINYAQNQDVISIQHVTGLQANQSYTLNVMTIG